MVKKLDGNCIMMLRGILNKSWKQHLTKQWLYGHLPPISKTIQIWRIRHEGNCWMSKDQLISDVLLLTPSYERSSVEWPARTYLQQLSADTECDLEDLLKAMDGDRDRELGKSVRVTWHDDDDDLIFNFLKFCILKKTYLVCENDKIIFIYGIGMQLRVNC